MKKILARKSGPLFLFGLAAAALIAACSLLAVGEDYDYPEDRNLPRVAVRVSVPQGRSASVSSRAVSAAEGKAAANFYQVTFRNANGGSPKYYTVSAYKGDTVQIYLPAGFEYDALLLAGQREGRILLGTDYFPAAIIDAENKTVTFDLTGQYIDFDIADVATWLTADQGGSVVLDNYDNYTQIPLAQTTNAAITLTIPGVKSLIDAMDPAADGIEEFIFSTQDVRLVRIDGVSPSFPVIKVTGDPSVPAALATDLTLDFTIAPPAEDTYGQLKFYIGYQAFNDALSRGYLWKIVPGLNTTKFQNLTGGGSTNGTFLVKIGTGGGNDPSDDIVEVSPDVTS
jgi:hypothetical protein